MDTPSENDISAEEFVERLLTEGEEVTCDKTNDSFSKCDGLPEFYDKKLFKAGQEFCMKNLYSIYLLHALGIIHLFSIPTLLAVILSVGSTATSLFQAFKRQHQTNLLLYSFYQLDLDKQNKLWKNIIQIRNRHNFVSNGSNKKGFNRILQKDMAITQHIFIGLSLIRGHMVGLHQVTEEEWQGYHHLWRVIGYLLGIEERFNICSVPLEKTKRIAELLIDRHFKIAMDKKDKQFLDVAIMASLSWCPMLAGFYPKCAMNQAYNLLLKPNSNESCTAPTYIEMNAFSQLYFKLLCFENEYLMRWSVYRIIRNVTFKVNLWLITTFAILPTIWLKIVGHYNL